MLVYLPVVVDYRCRVIRFHHARVAHLAVLVAPIGIVVDRACQVVYLLRNRSRLTALGGRTEGYERQTIAVVPFLLGSKEITAGVVLNTLANDVLLVNIRREAECHLSYKCPSVSQYARSIRRIHTCFVVTVGTRDTYFPSLCKARSLHQVVRGVTQTAKAEVGCLHRIDHLFVAACIVQTTHRREVKLTSLGTIEVDAVDVVLFGSLLVAAVAITRCGPSKGSE